MKEIELTKEEKLEIMIEKARNIDPEIEARHMRKLRQRQAEYNKLHKEFMAFVRRYENENN